MNSHYKIFAFLLISILCFSCKDKATLTISNDLDNVSLLNVNWDGNILAFELLPGQSSSIELNPNVYDLPISDVIRFEMKSLNRRIGLRTVDEILVEEGDNIRIEVDSALQVTVN